MFDGLVLLERLAEERLVLERLEQRAVVVLESRPGLGCDASRNPVACSPSLSSTAKRVRLTGERVVE